jgi:enoyl-CoA hydratase/carnithine racemase
LNIARLVSLIRPARTKDLIFKARLAEAPAALALGLLNEVVSDLETLLRRADEKAKLVAGHAQINARGDKRAVRRIRRDAVRDQGEDLTLRAYMSEDFGEGVRRLDDLVMVAEPAPVGWLFMSSERAVFFHFC